MSNNLYNLKQNRPGRPLGGRTYGRGAQKFSSTRYSSAILDGVSSTQTYQLFQTTRAQSGLAITNMDDTNQFPSGVKFNVEKIGLRVFSESTDIDPQIIANLREILKNSTLKFNLTGFQDVGLFPVSEWLQTENYVSIAASGIAPIYNASTTSAQWKALEIPIVLEPRVLFGMELSLNTPVVSANVAGSKIMVLLRGVEERRGA